MKSYLLHCFSKPGIIEERASLASDSGSQEGIPPTPSHLGYATGQHGPGRLLIALPPVALPLPRNSQNIRRGNTMPRLATEAPARPPIRSALIIPTTCRSQPALSLTVSQPASKLF